GESEQDSQPVAQQPEPAPQKITVEPIAEPPPPPVPVQVVQQPAVEPDPPAPAPAPTPKSAAHHHHDVKKATTVAVEKKTDLTRDTVAGKFRSVSREYDAYKAKNGGRLDQEWNDLATYMQFH